MRKRYCITIGLLAVCFLSRSKTTYLINSAGSYINSDSGTAVLNNASLVNSGSINSNGKTIFWRTQQTTVGGTGKSSLKYTTINKPGTALLMTGDITTTGAIHFSGGLLDVNTHTANLSASGQLSGENETAHITGVSGGHIAVSAGNINSPANLNAGNLGAVISSSQSLGTISISRYHKPFENPGNSAFTGIQRSYFIQPANNSSLNATLRFYYLDSELNGKDQNTLNLWQSSDDVQ